MKYQLITLFVIVSVCHGQSTVSPKANHAQTTPTVGDSIIVNNVTDPLPPVTDSPATNGTTQSPNSTTTTTTTEKPTTTTTKSTTVTTKTTSTEAPTTTKPATTTVPSPPPPNSTTTLKPTEGPTTKEPPTKSPSTTTVTPTPANNRKFDGPSFVGGIVLASGLMAIGFVAFKFYRARTELNYHTL